MTKFIHNNQEIILDYFAININSIALEVNHVKTPSIMCSIADKEFDVAKSANVNMMAVHNKIVDYGHTIYTIVKKLLTR